MELKPLQTLTHIFKRLRIFTLGCFFIILFFSLPIAYGQDEFHVSNDFSYTYNDTTGAGSEQSSLTEGLRYLNNLGVNGTGKVARFDYRLNLGMLLTDDSRNDVQTFSATNLQLNLADEIQTLNVGDTFQSFSQYSLNTAVKGGSYRFFENESAFPELTVIYGYANPRWDNLWDFGGDKVESIKREVFGGRLKKSLSDQFSAGLSFAQSNDSDRISDDQALYESRSYTMDWQYLPIPGLTIEGESSLSDTTESPAVDAVDEDSHGYAHKVTAIGSGGPSRVTLEYEYVSPDFLTLLGSATPDREKTKAAWRYRLDEFYTLNTGFLWYRDNLDDQKEERTDHYRPEISLTRNKMFQRKYARADVSYKVDIRETDRTTTSRTDHITNVNYSDRFGWCDSDSNFGYTLYQIKEADSERNNEFTYNTSLNSRHTVGNFTVKPSVYLGGWTSRKELEEETDQIYEYSFGIGVDAPRWNITSDFKVGQNELKKDNGDDSAKIFGRVSLYYKPECLEKLNYCNFFLRAYINDFDYTTDDRDFRETSITAGLNLQL